MTAISPETSLEIRYTFHVTVPEKKALKITKYPICFHPSEFSNLLCFLCVLLTLGTGMSRGWMCVWSALAHLPWQSWMLGQCISFVLFWAKLLWKLLFKGIYPSRIWRESCWEEGILKMDHKGQMGFAGESESNGDGKWENSADGEEGPACAWNWTWERAWPFLQSAKAQSVCECICVSGTWVSVYVCAYVCVCEPMFEGVSGGRWQTVRLERWEPYWYLFGNVCDFSSSSIN